MGRLVHFEIPADDPQRAIDFYEAVLGWTAQRWDGPCRLLARSPPATSGPRHRRRGDAAPRARRAAGRRRGHCSCARPRSRTWTPRSRPSIDAGGSIRRCSALTIPGVGEHGVRARHRGQHVRADAARLRRTPDRRSPPATIQGDGIASRTGHRAAALLPARPTSPSRPHKPPIWRRAGGWSWPRACCCSSSGPSSRALLLLLPKLKLFTTSASMLVSIGAYALIWGWQFGVGLRAAAAGARDGPRAPAAP